MSNGIKTNNEDAIRLNEILFDLLSWCRKNDGDTIDIQTMFGSQEGEAGIFVKCHFEADSLSGEAYHKRLLDLVENKSDWHSHVSPSMREKINSLRKDDNQELVEDLG
jgi:hypothetical protein